MLRTFKITIFLTNHLLYAVKEYSLEVEDVLYAVLFPDDVVGGHSRRFVAYKLLNDYLTRVVYEYENGIPVVITFIYCQSER